MYYNKQISIKITKFSIQYKVPLLDKKIQPLKCDIQLPRCKAWYLSGEG